MTGLVIEGVSFAYGDQQVLDGIDLEVGPGEIVAIVGSSGVGKSTLFNLIAGLLPLQQGEIRLDGKPDLAGRISYMLQKDLLLEHKTVMGNIILPLQLSGVKKRAAIAEASQFLDQFGLSETRDKYPAELSGGMRQRIALLRTCLFKQRIFLLDEAFSALDALTKRELHRWYLDLHAKLGLTTLLITHDIDEALTLADRIYILKNRPGQLVKEIQVTEAIKASNSLDYLQVKQEILDSLGL